VTTPPRTGETYQVDCPHCGRTFEADMLGGSSERNRGFKCPHCRLFVAFAPAEEQDRVEPAGD
jgi:DNA-directed RNA polymerase subunit RPC12/RpoP